MRTMFILAGIFLAAPSSSFAFSANVFDHDSREAVTKVSAPWSAVGKLLSPDGSYCTATLIAPDLVLTAAHCIMKNGALRVGTFQFVPRYSHGGAQRAGVNHFWWGTTDPADYRGNDWAIARLDSPLGDTFGWLGVRSYEGSELLKDRTYYMAAYSEDFGLGEIASWEKGFRFRRFNALEGYLLHDGDMSRGASGAAIFIYDDAANPASSNHVVAINVADFREGSNKSLTGIPYSDDHANVAVPSAAFYPTFQKIRDGSI